MRKPVIFTGLIFIAALLLFMLLMRWAEPRMIFDPGPTPSRTPKALGLDFEEVRFSTPDGETLHGWWIPGARTLGPMLLYFHGNGGTRENRLEILRELSQAGFPVFIVDYRGYGGGTGQPSERGLVLDGVAAFDWLRERAPQRPILLMGHSLGGAVAAQTALRRKAAGLILESAFTNIPEMAGLVVPLPRTLLRLLVRTQFDNLAALRQLRLPLLIVHGDQDEVVPYSMAGVLYAASGSVEKRLQPLSGAHHNDTFAVGGAAYLQVLREFATRVAGE